MHAMDVRAVYYPVIPSSNLQDARARPLIIAPRAVWPSALPFSLMAALIFSRASKQPMEKPSKCLNLLLMLRIVCERLYYFHRHRHTFACIFQVFQCFLLSRIDVKSARVHFTHKFFYLFVCLRAKYLLYSARNKTVCSNDACGHCAMHICYTTFICLKCNLFQLFVCNAFLVHVSD